MIQRKTLAFATTALAVTALVATLTGRDLTAAADDPVGSCSFSLKNQWVGPLKTCMSPSSAAECDATGKKDENSNAVFQAAACPAAGLVGTCKTEKYSMHYYEGEAANLEIGCGFQQGEWITAAK